MRGRVAWLSAMAVLAGCEHVKLTAPALSAPLEERQKAYQELKPRQTEDYYIVEARRMKWTRSLVLNDGREVLDPVDLRPVVLPDSETARFIDSYADKNEPWPIIGWVALASGAIGAGLLTTVIAGLTRSLSPGAQNGLAVTGVVFAIAVPLGALLTGWLIVPDSEEDRLSAFSTYDADLRRRLGLTD